MFTKVIRNNIQLAIGRDAYRQARLVEIVVEVVAVCLIVWLCCWAYAVAI